MNFPICTTKILTPACACMTSRSILNKIVSNYGSAQSYHFDTQWASSITIATILSATSGFSMESLHLCPSTASRTLNNRLQFFKSFWVAYRFLLILSLPAELLLFRFKFQIWRARFLQSIFDSLGKNDVRYVVLQLHQEYCSLIPWLLCVFASSVFSPSPMGVCVVRAQYATVWWHQSIRT